jgi:hypothetical protein
MRKSHPCPLRLLAAIGVALATTQTGLGQPAEIGESKQLFVDDGT